MPRVKTSKDVGVSPDVHQWLTELEELTGIKGKPKMLSYIKRVWGDRIKQHLVDPSNPVPVPGNSRVLPSIKRELPPTDPVSTRANPVPSPDPKTARLAALKSRKIGN